MKWLANHKRREEMKKGEGRKTCNKSTKTCAGLSCRKYKMMLRESAEGTAKLLSRFSRARLCGPARLPRPWDSPGRNTGVGCHFLLQSMKEKGESLSRVRLFKTHRLHGHNFSINHVTSCIHLGLTQK